jgi:hypothetical protein
VVVVRVAETRKVAVRAVAMQLQVRDRELVRVLARAGAVDVDLAVVDVVHACFPEPTPFV